MVGCIDPIDSRKAWPNDYFLELVPFRLSGLSRNRGKTINYWNHCLIPDRAFLAIKPHVLAHYRRIQSSKTFSVLVTTLLASFPIRLAVPST